MDLARMDATEPLQWNPWMRRFLRVLCASGGNASAAIRAVKGNANRSTVYQYKNRCPIFAQRWDAVLHEHDQIKAASRRLRKK